MKNSNYILVTGAAGFIGAALSKKLLENGNNVIGIDNLNKYYDLKLKKDRLRDLKLLSNKIKGEWIFKKIDLVDRKRIFRLFKKYQPNIVINLAAQAGVRYSLLNPNSYIQSNILGFSNVIEASVEIKVENFIYASSSSVYGLNQKIPFDEDHKVDHPVSLYAATKRSNELIAHSFSNIYALPATGLRFFTVYGPWGRPDMAPMIFTKAIMEGQSIDVFNYGEMLRDFTYIDDVVNCIYLCCDKPATKNNDFDLLNPKSSSSFAPHRIFNIGNSNPIELKRFIQLLEDEIGKKALKKYMPMQKGDVISTSAYMENIKDWVGFEPKINIKKGIENFVAWYKKYYY